MQKIIFAYNAVFLLLDIVHSRFTGFQFCQGKNGFQKDQLVGFVSSIQKMTETKRSKYKQLQSTFYAANFMCRLSWPISSFGAIHC